MDSMGQSSNMHGSVVYGVVCNDHRGLLLGEGGCVRRRGTVVYKINASMHFHINIYILLDKSWIRKYGFKEHF